MIDEAQVSTPVVADDIAARLGGRRIVGAPCRGHLQAAARRVDIVLMSSGSRAAVFVVAASVLVTGAACSGSSSSANRSSLASSTLIPQVPPPHAARALTAQIAPRVPVARAQQLLKSLSFNDALFAVRGFWELDGRKVIIYVAKKDPAAIRRLTKAMVDSGDFSTVTATTAM